MNGKHVFDDGDILAVVRRFAVHFAVVTGKFWREFYRILQYIVRAVQQGPGRKLWRTLQFFGRPGGPKRPGQVSNECCMPDTSTHTVQCPDACFSGNYRAIKMGTSSRMSGSYTRAGLFILYLVDQ